MLAISGGGQEPRALRRMEHLVSHPRHRHDCLPFAIKREWLKRLNRPHCPQRTSSNAVIAEGSGMDSGGAVGATTSVLLPGMEPGGGVGPAFGFALGMALALGLAVAVPVSDFVLLANG